MPLNWNSIPMQRVRERRVLRSYGTAPLSPPGITEYTDAATVPINIDVTHHSSAVWQSTVRSAGSIQHSSPWTVGTTSLVIPAPANLQVGDDITLVVIYDSFGTTNPTLTANQDNASWASQATPMDNAGGLVQMRYHQINSIDATIAGRTSWTFTFGGSNLPANSVGLIYVSNSEIIQSAQQPLGTAGAAFSTTHSYVLDSSDLDPFNYEELWVGIAAYTSAQDEILTGTGGTNILTSVYSPAGDIGGAIIAKVLPQDEEALTLNLTSANTVTVLMGGMWCYSHAGATVTNTWDMAHYNDAATVPIDIQASGVDVYEAAPIEMAQYMEPRIYTQARRAALMGRRW